jgi:hypothetical protein
MIATSSCGTCTAGSGDRGCGWTCGRCTRPCNDYNYSTSTTERGPVQEEKKEKPQPEQFNRVGHLFPLKEGKLDKRPIRRFNRVR